MRAEAKPVQRAMYVATQLDKSWLLDVQRKLYARSWNEPVYVWCKLWGLVTDRRNLRLALERVARNRGARSAGVDGLTVTFFASTSMESPVHNERCTPGLERGTQKPPGASRARR
jgi:retron-type reverse transcriptase